MPLKENMPFGAASCSQTNVTLKERPPNATKLAACSTPEDQHSQGVQFYCSAVGAPAFPRAKFFFFGGVLI